MYEYQKGTHILYEYTHPHTHTHILCEEMHLVCTHLAHYFLTFGRSFLTLRKKFKKILHSSSSSELQWAHTTVSPPYHSNNDL